MTDPSIQFEMVSDVPGQEEYAVRCDKVRVAAYVRREWGGSWSWSVRGLVRTFESGRCRRKGAAMARAWRVFAQLREGLKLGQIDES